MPTKRGRWMDMLALFGIGLAVLASTRCGSPTDDPRFCATEATAILEQFGHRVALPTFGRFRDAAAELEVATATYEASLSEADQAAARLAWTAVMDVWERAEMMQVGPLAAATRPGGRDLRDEIYAWPVSNRCQIDQALVSLTYVDRDAFATELVSVRGLAALEYLLFNDAPGNSCSDISPINADGTWNALGADETRRRRASYAATLAYLVHAQALALVAAWDPSGDDFAGALTRTDGMPYSDAPTALNAVSDALFYLDTETKDVKLTAATGAEVESPYAERSKEHAIANLSAFLEVFGGGSPGADGPGFNDLLQGVGEGELATRVATNAMAAIEALEAIDTSLRVAVESDPAAVRAAYDAVARVTDDLKGRFVVALCLQIPIEAGGDTD